MTVQDDIAIVGMASLYPEADDIDVFWSNILHKKDALTESSEEWLGDGQIFDPESDDPLKIYLRKGGFLNGLSRFDAREFGTMPLSVEGAQPDQFIALKLARDALIDAGCVPGEFDGSRTGVILGHAVHAHRANTNGIHQGWFASQIASVLKALSPNLNDEQVKQALDLMHSQMPSISQDAIPGLVPNILTGRIANRLDLMGPNYIIDAACASSLITVDLARNELLSGNADIMLAGGVNTTTSPLVYAVFCGVGALSRTGEIRPFDSVANGTVLGEGAGVVVLKRLSDAIAADDRIYAVIKGLGQSSDGRSSGLMAPRVEGEMLAIQRAYETSGIEPSTIGLVEAHGTGIPLGDRTEVEALRGIFGERTKETPTIAIGSVKSMIGHCIPAAGSASMIKTALALKHKIIPPTICDSVNGEIGLEDTPFYVSTQTRPWIHSKPSPRRAAINAFGFGGINAHMVLEEAPGGNEPDATAVFSLTLSPDVDDEHVFFFSDHTCEELLAGIDALINADDDIDFGELAKKSWELASSRAGAQRLSIVASNRADLLKKLTTASEKIKKPDTDQFHTRNGVHYQSQPTGGKVAFLFPGEMAQYPDMLRESALDYPVVRDWFDFIGSIADGRRGTRIQDVIFPPPTLVDEPGKAHLENLMHRVDYGSEMVFAADQAVHSMLRMLGVAPDSMLGHSTGENAAIVASGYLELDRASIGDMISRMNDIFEDVEKQDVVPKGVLLTVAAYDRSALVALLDEYSNVHFTMDNCPNQSVLFGDEGDIDSIQNKVVSEGAVCSKLPISWGYHTDYVLPMAERFEALFGDVNLKPSGVTLYSCATAAPFPKDKESFRETAVNQYVSRVRFTEAIERLYEDGHRIFVECGPNANLTAFVRDILGDKPHLAESADNRRRGLVSQLRHLLGRLFVAGVRIDPTAIMKPAPTRDQKRRAKERQKHQAAPALPSETPYIHLDAGKAETLRTLVLGEGGANHGIETPMSPASQPLAAATDPAQAVYNAPPAFAENAAQQAASDAAAVNEHIFLMDDFVKGQGRIASELLDKNFPPPATDTAAPAQQISSNRRQKILTLNIGEKFATPFPLRAYLMTGQPSLAGVSPFLGHAEQIEANARSADKGASRAWFEWALSRLSVKRAAGELAFGGAGLTPDAASLEVFKNDEGAPFLKSDLSSGPLPSISIAHAGGYGLGAAADAHWRIGLDFDLPSRVQNPGEFIDVVLNDDEQRRLSLAPTGANAVAVWVLKEAAAKALGVGVQGRPKDFSIVANNADMKTAVVVYGAHKVDAIIQPVSDGICAIAYLRVS